MKSGIRFDRKNGYLGLQLFGLLLLFVWGFHGNVYGMPCLRIGRLPLIGNPGISFTSNYSGGFRETYVALTIRKRLTWNSEHLAYSYGKYCEGNYHGSPECWIYNGLFGNHIYV